MNPKFPLPGAARPATAVLVCAALLMASCLTDSDPPRKRMFATSQVYQGAFGGLAAADSICGHLAGAAALGGRWRAFLSDGNTDAPDRVSNQGAWYRVDRETKVFNNRTGFTVGAIAAIRNEYNSSLPNSARAWTGTRADGTADGAQHCGNWTDSTAYATTGRPNSTLNNGPHWMFGNEGATPCTIANHLYCFEQ